MKTSSLGIIVLIAVLLLGGIYFLNQEGPPARDESGNQRLFRIDREKISQVSLVRDETSIRIRKNTGRGWSLQKPIQYPADEQSISSLLSDIEFARINRTLDLSQVKNADKQIELFGLNRQGSSIRLKAGEETYELVIGVETVRPGQVYARLKHNSRSEVVIIDQAIPELLENPLAFWRSKRLIELETDAINTVVVRQGEQEIRLERSGEQWAIAKPFGSPVDLTGLQSYLATVTGARVREFVDDQAGDLATFGLNNPALAVEFHESDEKRHILRFGNVKEEDEDLIYASSNTYQMVYSVPKPLKDSLANIIATTRDKRLLPVNTGQEIKSIKVNSSMGQEAFTVIRDEEAGWHLDGQPEIRMDTDSITNFLDALLQARATTFQALPAPESEAMKEFKSGVQATIEIGTEDDRYQIAFGKRTEDTQMTTTTYQPFLLEMNRRMDDLTPVSVYDWYPRQISLVSDQPDRLEWVRSDKGLVVERDEQGMWVDTQTEKTIQQDFIQRQISLLQSLRAQGRFEVDASRFRQPDLTLRIQEGGETSIIEFRLAESGGQFLGRVVGSDVGFLLSEQDFLTLETFPVPTGK